MKNKMALDTSVIGEDFFEKLERVELDNLTPDKFGYFELKSELHSKAIRIETVGIPPLEKNQDIQNSYFYITAIYDNSWDGMDVLARTESQTLQQALQTHISAIDYLKKLGF